MDDPLDERFKVEGDPEVALRGLLSTAPGTLAALDAKTRARFAMSNRPTRRIG